MPSSTGHSCIDQQSKLRLVLVIIVLTLFMKHFRNQSYNGPYMHVKYTGGKSNVCFHKWTFICLTRPSKIPSATLKKWSCEQDQSQLNYCNWINQSAFCFVFFSQLQNTNPPQQHVAWTRCTSDDPLWQAPRPKAVGIYRILLLLAFRNHSSCNIRQPSPSLSFEFKTEVKRLQSISFKCQFSARLAAN